MKTIGLLFLGAWFVAPALAGLVVTKTTTEPAYGSDTNIVLYQREQDFNGNTRFRYFAERIGLAPGQPLSTNTYGLKTDTLENAPAMSYYYMRDRDLGQIFTTGTNGYYLDAITLKVGPDMNANQGAAANAKVSLQILRVTGTPVLNRNGTTGNQKPKWKTCCGQTATTDDYIEGLTFTTVRLIRGGVLPADVGTQNVSTRKDRGEWLRWDLTGPDQIWLEPTNRYAFMVMFDEPADNRGLALANINRAQQGIMPASGDHALRREGSSLNRTEIFIHDLNDSADVEPARLASMLPSNITERVALPPGTLGYPDVCTYRELVFFIHASANPDPAEVRLEPVTPVGAFHAAQSGISRVKRDEPGREPLPIVATLSKAMLWPVRITKRCPAAW